MPAHDEPNNPPDEDPAALLAQIRERAERLLNQLIFEQRELDRNPPQISAEVLREGRAAMQQALTAARRTVEALAAAALQDAQRDGDDTPGESYRLN